MDRSGETIFTPPERRPSAPSTMSPEARLSPTETTRSSQHARTVFTGRELGRAAHLSVAERAGELRLAGGLRAGNHSGEAGRGAGEGPAHQHDVIAACLRLHLRRVRQAGELRLDLRRPGGTRRDECEVCQGGGDASSRAPARRIAAVYLQPVAGSLAILRASNASSASRRATPPSIFVAPFSSGSSAATPTARSVDSPSSFRSKAPAVVTVPVALRSAWPLSGPHHKQSKACEVAHRRREAAGKLAARCRPSEACARAVERKLQAFDCNRLAGRPRSVSTQPHRRANRIAQAGVGQCNTLRRRLQA